MRIAVWYFICAHICASWLSFLSNSRYFRTKTQENFLPILSSKKAKIWRNSELQRRKRSLALSYLGSNCNQEERLKELEDTSPANQAGRQTTTSASRTKMMKNGRDSETSRHKRIKRRCRRCRPRDFLSLASRGILSKKCLENEGAVKLKQYQCGWRKISRQFTWNILEHPRTSNNDNNNDNNFEKNI